ncbi:hypothetical protein Tco_1384511 [Tanacetum coccineum]
MKEKKEEDELRRECGKQEKRKERRKRRGKENRRKEEIKDKKIVCWCGNEKWCGVITKKGEEEACPIDLNPVFVGEHIVVAIEFKVMVFDKSVFKS